MLKTVLKCLIFYAILSAIVSGCSLIGEYCEGFDDVPSDNQSLVLTETVDKPANKPEKKSKTKLLNISFNVNESICKEPLNKLNYTKHIVPSEAVMYLDTDLPKDLIQTALAELKKRRMNLREMIFDRTLQDVVLAKNILNDKIKKGKTITDEERAILERGLLTINTINRIDGKTAELKSVINEMGYYNTPFVTKEWSTTDIFTKSDIERIISNCMHFANAFFVYDNTPKSVKPKYYFEEINKIERILNDVQAMAEEMVSKYRYCGEVECGG